ncbi:MAG: 30S ribosomal protein S21 [Flavobacteriales bacterium]|nr:30S ribosomal protein S21 [Flavobacteriales bacterium]
MLIINVKEGESIERALKKYKKKYDRTKVVRELRSRQQFTKPSVERRAEVIKAKYVQQLKQKEA